MKTKLARAAHCQIAYLSRVLEHEAHLSLEQAIAIQETLGHSRDESRFFLLLVEWDRASTPALRAHFQSEIDSVRRHRADLQSRFQVQSALSEQDQSTYYSSYQFLATHVCLSIPELQTFEALEHFLRVPAERLREILDFLVRSGLAERTQGRYRIGAARLHLGRSSPLIRQHHVNWRVEAIRSLERGSGASGSEDLHYSAAVSLSQEDCFRLKELWIKTLETFNQQIALSKEETVRCLVLDFFSLG
jgi:hypothetical protein